MRRAFLALLALCSLNVADSAAQVTLGLKAGANVSDLAVTDAVGEDVDWKSKTAFTGGAYLQLGLSDLFALQPEVLYSPKGAKQVIGDETFSIDLTYIDVPLLLVFHIPVGDSPIWPIAYVGPMLSIETGCSLRGDDVSVDCDAGDTSTSRTNDLDAGVTFGLGFEFFFGSFRPVLDARYTVGLTDINATDSGGSVKNRGWTFLFGLGYALVP